ncbi:MAG: hypothetical protein ABI717_05800 [Actinomycetota bacterium]
MTEELVPRDEARAALEARRELGPGYEDELVERFAERIERRLEDRRPAKRPADQGTAIVIVSLITAIPLIGIAASTVGLAGVIAVCAALVLVNWVVRN